MIEAVLAGVARANLAAAVAVLLVLMLRRPVRRAFGARAAYALWAMVPLAAMAALLPQPAAKAAMLAPVLLEATAVAAGPAMPETWSTGELASPALLSLWLAGAAAVAVLLVRRQARFVASLGRLEPVSARPRVLRAEHSGVGPAVVGALKPRIVTPADFENRFDSGEREVILAHEEAHLAMGDARINALAAAAQCLGWFNPLIHLGVHRLRIDQELACDAAVLRRFPATRRLYAEVLLKTQLTTQPLPLGCHWPASGDHPLKERIVMLKSPLPTSSRRAAGLAVVTALSLGSACAAWAAQPGAGLEPEQARKLAGPHGHYVCRPDANLELHNCKILARSIWEQIATATDIAREYPPAALKAGLTADVLLRCAVDRATGRLANCAAIEINGPAGEALPAGSSAAFSRAAVKVAGLYRLASGGPPTPNIMLMTLQFRKDPIMPGGELVGPAPTHAPAAIALASSGRP